MQANLVSQLRAAALLLVLAALSLSHLAGQRPRPEPILTLVTQGYAPTQDSGPAQSSAVHVQAPVNFFRFHPAQEGKSVETNEAEIQELTVAFKANTTITSIESRSLDFKLLEGGSCAKDQTYRPGENCTLRVAFAPQGPGNRTGKINITHTAAAHPESIGLAGVNYAPAVSFVPSIINNIPSTYNSTTKTGVFTYAYSLAIDGGDNLYIADLGGGDSNKPPVIDIIDSSGALSLYAGSGQSTANGIFATEASLNSPQGIAADDYGSLFIGDYEDGTLFQVDLDGLFSTIAGGSDSCTTLPCPAFGYDLVGITGVALTPREQIYMSMFGTGKDLQLLDGDLYVYAQDPDGDDEPLDLAIDSNDRLYYSTLGYCQVRSVDPSTQFLSIVAGTHSCGYSGDGGQARGAELFNPREVAVDAANNVYIADAGNYVIRRIDAATGLIHTIAGVAGKSSSSGNGGPATAANFPQPWGLAVDSNGSVYVADTKAGTVRKIGPLGNLVFSSVIGAASPVQVITMSNTGNNTLNLTQVYSSGPNASAFAIDPHTTTCPFASSGVGSLGSGATCSIGFLFNTATAGSFSNTINFVDNTGLGINSIQLNGTGLKKTPVLTWPKPASITTATALGNAQLNATAAYGGAALPGTFVYNPAAGTKLTAGTHTLTVAFTPTNTALYANVNASVSIVVTAPATKTKPSVALATSKNPVTTRSPITFSVTLPEMDRKLPTGSIHFYDRGRSLGTASLVEGKSTLKLPSLPAGTHMISAEYSGDSHFSAASSKPLVQIVQVLHTVAR